MINVSDSVPFKVLAVNTPKDGKAGGDNSGKGAPEPANLTKAPQSKAQQSKQGSEDRKAGGIKSSKGAAEPADLTKAKKSNQSSKDRKAGGKTSGKGVAEHADLTKAKQSKQSSLTDPVRRRESYLSGVYHRARKASLKDGANDEDAKTAARKAIAEARKKWVEENSSSGAAGDDKGYC